MEWALAQNSLPAPAKSVLFVLAHRAGNASADCWPGRETIAEEAGCSPRQVTRHLQLLVDHGLVARDRRFRRNGSRTSDRYYLLIDQVP